MIILGSSSAASVTTPQFFRTSGYDTIFELASDIDEEISTKDALVIYGDGEDSDVEGDEFELHMNANETEYSVEDDSIKSEGNVGRWYCNDGLRSIDIN